METTFPGTVEPTSYSAMGFLSFLLPRPPFLMLVFFSAVASSVLTCYQRRLLLPTLARWHCCRAATYTQDAPAEA